MGHKRLIVPGKDFGLLTDHTDGERRKGVTIMVAFQPELRPVALPDQVVRFEPDNTLRRVRSVEQIPLIGPVDFGAVTSGSAATNSNGEEEIEVTELEMSQNQFGQFRTQVVSPVEIEPRQTGKQEQRFATSNTVGVFAPTTPPVLSDLFVLTGGVPYFVVNNPNTYDLDKSLVSFHGFKYLLEPGELDEGQVSGQPIAVPTDRLEQSTQRGSQTAAQTRGTARQAHRGGR